MGLCGGFRCGCGVTSSPASGGAIGGELPSIEVTGSGEPSDPYDLSLNDAWAVNVAALLAQTTDWEDWGPPTWTNLTLGASTQTWRARQRNGDLHIRGLVTLGAGFAVSSGARFAHGVTLDGSVRSIGHAWLIDAGGTNHLGTCQAAADGQVYIYNRDILAISSTVPFTWAVNDTIGIDLIIAVEP